MAKLFKRLLGLLLLGAFIAFAVFLMDLAGSAGEGRQLRLTRAGQVIDAMWPGRSGPPFGINDPAPLPDPTLTWEVMPDGTARKAKIRRLRELRDDPDRTPVHQVTEGGFDIVMLVTTNDFDEGREYSRKDLNKVQPRAANCNHRGGFTSKMGILEGDETDDGPTATCLTIDATVSYETRRGETRQVELPRFCAPKWRQTTEAAPGAPEGYDDGFTEELFVCPGAKLRGHRRGLPVELDGHGRWRIVHQDSIRSTDVLNFFLSDFGLREWVDSY